MADIPDQPVLRRVEHGMEGDRQLDHAEAGAQMPARHRNGADRLLPQFVRYLLQLILWDKTQIRG
ncbi:hypothetical protein GCM10007874_64380 [Labrys miyagiensis]|uniref:Uncharacterized protein n=1 Tax=Labrys miyagiensis TaxID=346912 RepID=A0ABQ6CSV8_9HYPH|nr:hypothetical protein GCM10007874_64380 [Labrys miyagiensis]